MINMWQDMIGRLPFEWAHFVFMQNALLAILLVSPVFGLLGCMVINNQMAFYSEAIGHATLTGVAIGVLAGLDDPTPAMLGVAIVLAILMTLVRRFSSVSADTVIGLAMAFTVALGVVMLSRGGGFGKYSRYLIGDILTITPGEIGKILLIFVCVLLVWILIFNRIFLVSTHHVLAHSRGIRVWVTETAFAVMTALVVTLCIPWVGMLVINSMLILPAATSRNIAVNTSQYYLYAVSMAMISGVLGLLLSYYLGAAAGASIVLVAIALFVISLALRAIRGRSGNRELPSSRI